MNTIDRNVNSIATRENGTEFPQKLKQELPCDPVIPLLGVHSKDLQSRSQKKISIPMFIAALCTRAEIEK